ncbi:hypothetical protein [Fodinicola acaciae]|uniref:hypothetical protein n=1 Tax=Fodinicola acaciae TaxID=2681555 RepID=UPI0013D61490|nr:hypothetical protein [Fodinicola acaciae]
MTGLRRFTLTAGLAAAILAAGAPAYADSSRCTSDSGCAGKATFASYGEVFTVYDQKADGHSAALLYWLPDGVGPIYVWNHSGNGTSVKADLELPEGSWVTYRVCLGEYGTKQIIASTCGATITDYA